MSRKRPSHRRKCPWLHLAAPHLEIGQERDLRLRAIFRPIRGHRGGQRG